MQGFYNSGLYLVELHKLIFAGSMPCHFFSTLGGPLYDKQNKTLVGVVSFGNGCARTDYPGVYARISSQIDWIKNESCSRSNALSELCENLVPTVSPAPTLLSSHPTNLESNPPSSVPTAECKDTTLDFLVKLKKGKRKYKNCAW